MNSDKNLLRLIENFQADEPAFFRYTSPLLWNDPWISKQMLKAHLDPDHDGASRTRRFIDESADFICRRFGVGPGKRLVDFGCGPGLYAIRFARRGAEVTGIDLSENSLAYARKAASEEGLSIRYIQADYLDGPVTEKADLAVMIYCDFGVFGPDKRGRLLANLRASLKPGGSFFFDVASLACLEKQKDERTWSYERGGFFSPKPYALLYERKIYPEEKAFVEKHLIVEGESSRIIHCWNACYSAESIGAALAEAGFTVENVYAAAAGSPYRDDSDFLAVAARA